MQTILTQTWDVNVIKLHTQSPLKRYTQVLHVSFYLNTHNSHYGQQPLWATIIS